MHRSAIFVLSGLLALLITGCNHRGAAVADSTTQPADAGDGKVFHDKKYHFSFVYPDNWTSRKGDDPEDVLTIDADKDKPQQAEITVSIPKLPPHIPGMLPLPAVEKGYIDDVKKRMQNVKEPLSEPLKIDGASARRFVITGNDKNGKRKLIVLAIFKGDHLFVITAEGAEDQFSTMKPAFDQIARSWKWAEQPK